MASRLGDWQDEEMLTVLKIIGIVLLCVVVLAAVLLLLGLLYPIRYRAGAKACGSFTDELPSFDTFFSERPQFASADWNAGSRIADFIQLIVGKNDLESTITLHAWWLFHLLTLDARIEEKILEYSVKLAGITIMKDTVEDVEIVRPGLEALFRDPEKPAPSRNPKKATSSGNPERTALSKTENSRTGEPATGPRAAIRQFIKDMRIAGIKISTIRTVSQTQLGRRAIHSLKRQGKELRKVVKPYIIKGYLRYGLADAAQTAFLYGLLAQKVYDVAGDGVEVQMDFFEPGLDLDVDADGKFALKPVLPIVFRLIEDKDVETYLRALKNIIDG